MRRLAIALGLVTLFTACATPRITLEPRYAAGEVREYEVEVVATTTRTINGTVSTEETVLRARSRLEVTETGPEGTRMDLRLTTERFTRDGRDQAVPPEQRATLTIDPEGRATTTDALGQDVDTLAPLLGIALPRGRVRVGQAFGEQAGGEERSGRVSGLRSVRGYDCAMVRLGITRPVLRERSIDGTTVVAAGTERATVDLTFAFREGLPVEITSHSRADTELSTGGIPVGTLLVESRTTLGLDQSSRS